MNPLRTTSSTTVRRRRAALAATAIAATLAVTLVGPPAQAAIGGIDTIAGTGVAGFAGDGGPATAAQLSFNQQSAYDSAGNLYVADFSNNRVRRVAPDGTITTVAGTGIPASGGDGGAATAASLWGPEGLAIDGSDTIYVSEFHGNRIRRFSAGGTISTYAGTGTFGDTGDGGPAAAAQLANPSGIAVDPAGAVYLTQPGSSVVRKITPGGTISRVAGTGAAGFSGDGGPALAAQLNTPRAVSVVNGNVMVSDTGNNRIRSISLGGTIVTIAGTGAAGFAGDGGLADDAQLNQPTGLVSTGLQLYIADSLNNRIRKVENGIITTVAGTGVAGYSGDGGPALLATMNFPVYPVLDPVGNLLVSDADNDVVRRLQIATPVEPTTTTTTSTTTTTVTPAVTPARSVTARPAFTG